jgi:F-type H+-transporting ATPase subunit b
MEQLLNDFSPGLFFMQAFILLVLILLMRKFAWKPILTALDTREENIKNAIESAEKAKDELSKLTSDKESLLKEAKAQRDIIIAEAQTSANGLVEEAKNIAKAEAADIASKASAALKAEKNAAIAELRSQAAILSVDIAEKILREELKDKKAQEALVAEYLKEADLTA